VTGGLERHPILRHPTEADQPRIAEVVDWWFGGQHVRHLVVRAWFRHFGSTSWLALDDERGDDADDGGAGAGDRPGGGSGPLGFLVGYRSQDHPTEAVLHLVGVDPNHRRRGIGRALVEAFVADATAAGAETAIAVAWPGEPIAAAFFRALGFEPDDGPGSRNLFGSPAFPDYEGDGEDRIVFVRRLLPRDPRA
jgi:ribosomal protein S18 acetylase RimI-like enzyme